MNVNIFLFLSFQLLYALRIVKKNTEKKKTNKKTKCNSMIYEKSQSYTYVHKITVFNS